MALPLSNTFETGLADETGIIEANSDDGTAGNPWDDVTFNGGSTGVYDTARALSGTLSGRFDQVTTNGCFITWDTTSIGSVTTIYGRLYVYVTAQPGAAFWFIVPESAGTRNGLIRWNAAGTVSVFDSTLGAATTGSQTVPLNEWVRMEWKLVCHASTGILEFKMFHGHEAAAIETVTKSSANTLAATDTVDIGQTAAFAVGTPWWLDDITLDDTGYPGPSVVSPMIRSQHLDFDYSR
jgi:hypothetical protein